MANVLIIEDDEVFSELLVMHLEDRNHVPHTASTLKQARQLLAESIPDAILLDQQLPDGFGTDILKEIADHSPHLPVIMITGVSDNTLAIQAMGLGAHDFIRKPMDEFGLDTTLSNALKSHRLSRQVSAITNTQDYQVDIGQIVGRSPSILEICKTIGSVASRNAPVLITGKSGTGKEVVARALHNHSGRTGLFLPINCSALAENLLESELFGHEKGSFTGAIVRKEGKFEQTADGTLFLDELGEMPASLQAKLLRVIQDGSFERVGGTQTMRSNARILAATNRDLKIMVGAGHFREDLFYRLNVVHIHLPSLRERMEDLPLLTEYLLSKINALQHTAVKHIAETAWRRMKEYQWPGNIRELENILTRAAVLARSDTITADLLALPDSIETKGFETNKIIDGISPQLLSLDELENEHIKKILEYTHWHKGKACEILGISRPALDRKITKYEL
ncbi:MAG: sigma-54 dependent transcriptional regulator [Candidatus Thiodiazotropha sp. (ex Dulcina madagascariensis)]|nr:sigma-54 dependent transcriptional regulator [Candidatus Thiodiazotropha sp. (ex Dulcina madagascariensis)]MCU7928447.1 sigma-54 dependent transcriptional regulator [Candidatus Thiodiazotropha sp. (ex Dulcina madagascariensis)]